MNTVYYFLTFPGYRRMITWFRLSNPHNFNWTISLVIRHCIKSIPNSLSTICGISKQWKVEISLSSFGESVLSFANACVDKAFPSCVINYTNRVASSFLIRTEFSIFFLMIQKLFSGWYIYLKLCHQLQKIETFM